MIYCNVSLRFIVGQLIKELLRAPFRRRRPLL